MAYGGPTLNYGGIASSEIRSGVKHTEGRPIYGEKFILYTERLVYRGQESLYAHCKESFPTDIILPKSNLKAFEYVFCQVSSSVGALLINIHK